MSEWQPIETAPKCERDQRWERVLCYWPQGGGYIDIAVWKHNGRIYDAVVAGERVECAPAYWTPDLYEWDDYEYGHPGNEPTHWMPLPEAPTQPQADSAQGE